MEKQCGPNDAGYKITITFNKKMRKYFIAGYTWHMDAANRVRSDQDGAVLTFDTMEEVIRHIVEYGN